MADPRTPRIDVRVPWNAERQWRTGQRVGRTIERRRRVRQVARLAAAASLGAVAIALPLALRPGPVESQTSAPPASATTAGRMVRFHDGSTAEIDGPREALVVERADERAIAVNLTAGAARFRVAPGAARAFQVQAGAVRIEILGGAFSVERRGPRAVVSCAEGHVVVRWATAAAVTLSAGMQGVYPPVEEAAAAERPAEPPAVERRRRIVEPASAPPAPTLAVSEAAAPAAVQAARAPASDDMPSRPVPDEPSFDALLRQADAARLSRKPTDALALIHAARARAEGVAQRQVAAFMAGRIHFDQLNDARAAAQAFVEARLLWPGGPLAEDALALAAEAHARAGSDALAREGARTYLEIYPRGAHAQRMAELANAAARTTRP